MTAQTILLLLSIRARKDHDQEQRLLWLSYARDTGNGPSAIVKRRAAFFEMTCRSVRGQLCMFEAAAKSQLIQRT
jgi:hypothetical protein